MKHKLVRVFTLGFLALSIASCGPNSNPLNVLERFEEEQLQRYSNGKIRMTDFRKINGRKGEVFGVQVYRIEYEVVYETTEDLFLPMSTLYDGESLEYWDGDYRFGFREMSDLVPVDTLVPYYGHEKEGFVLGHFKNVPHSRYYWDENGRQVRHFHVCKLIPAGTEISKKDEEQLVKKDNGWEID